MKLPQRPPNPEELLRDISDDPDLLLRALHAGQPVSRKGRYLHWDELRHRTPPDGLTHEQWWFGVSNNRRLLSRQIPLADVEGASFRFSNVDPVLEKVHRIDQQAGGQILTAELAIDPRTSSRYLVSSLVEEAITSSQLEGASTSRIVGKQLIQSGRPPRDRGERMILNNFNALRFAEHLVRGGDDLTLDSVLELHRVVTVDALDDPADAGRLQRPGEERVAVTAWDSDTVLYHPPPAEELPERLARMCDFANGRLGDGFIHPVVRAIVLHFWLAFDHPFADGNGPTARALFYWSMLRSGYWLTQYISISSILRKAPAQYGRAFLFAETDDNDLTYFIVYQLRVIERAIEGLKGYLARKVEEDRKLQALLQDGSRLNSRQLALLSDAIKDPVQQFTIKWHQRRHRVAYQSARTDLLKLEGLGLLVRSQVGTTFVFGAVNDLTDRIEKLGPG